MSKRNKNRETPSYEYVPTEGENKIAGVKGEKQWQEWGQAMEDYGVD